MFSNYFTEKFLRLKGGTGIFIKMKKKLNICSYCGKKTEHIYLYPRARFRFWI